MTNEFIVPTGFVVKDYMESNGLSQKEFASRLGSSEKHISNFLNGRIKLTNEFALKIEKVIGQVPASYWLNYEVKYREFLARTIEMENLFDKEELKNLSKRFKFSEVFKDINIDIRQQAMKMLQLLGIANFDRFEDVYSSLCVDFKEDGGSFESIVIWLCMAREEILLQNEDLHDMEFSRKDLVDNLAKIKDISSNENCSASIKSLRKLLNDIGIYLVVLEPLSNSKIRGALTKFWNKPAIYISGRFKTHDHIWFAIVHEIGHLLLHGKENDPIISMEDGQNSKSNKENEADRFARSFFIDEEAYNEFKKQTINENSIIEFGINQNTTAGIVVARLQHDGILSYKQFNHMKSRI